MYIETLTPAFHMIWSLEHGKPPISGYSVLWLPRLILRSSLNSVSQLLRGLHWRVLCKILLICDVSFFVTFQVSVSAFVSLNGILVV